MPSLNVASSVVAKEGGGEAEACSGCSSLRASLAEYKLRFREEQERCWELRGRVAELERRLGLRGEEDDEDDSEAAEAGVERRCGEKKRFRSSEAGATKQRILQNEVSEKRDGQPDIDEWECLTCHRMNKPGKSRCFACSGWKGGKRENFTRKKKRVRSGAYSAPPAGKRSRSTRCGSCEGCKRNEDCGNCINCLDKPKFGGPHTRKKACQFRQCTQMVPPEERSAQEKGGGDGAASQKRIVPAPPEVGSRSGELGASSATSAAKRLRSTRCGSCEGCARGYDCGKCLNCLDKPKFGGTNKRKQACMFRKCTRMVPPLEKGGGDGVTSQKRRSPSPSEVGSSSCSVVPRSLTHNSAFACADFCF